MLSLVQFLRAEQHQPYRTLLKQSFRMLHPEMLYFEADVHYIHYQFTIHYHEPSASRPFSHKKCIGNQGSHFVLTKPDVS